jgi:hypothetical protein
VAIAEVLRKFTFLESSKNPDQLITGMWQLPRLH